MGRSKDSRISQRRAVLDVPEDSPSPIAGPSRLGKRSKLVLSDSEDDDEVKVLTEAPPHMMKISNADNPITLEDSDDEDSRPLAKRRRLANKSVQPLEDGRFKNITSTSRRASTSSDDRESTSRVSPIPGSFVRDADSLSAPVAGSASSSLQAAPSLYLQDAAAIQKDDTTLLDDLPAVIEPADLLPRVLDILPDIDPEWVMNQLKVQPISEPGDAVNAVLQAALEMADGYPKAEIKAVTAEETGVKSYEDPNFRADRRSGALYIDSSIAALQDHFRTVPVTAIARAMSATNNLYYPAYMLIAAQLKTPDKPFAELKRPRLLKGSLTKGKDKDGVPATETNEWFLEHTYLMESLERSKREAREEAERLAAHDLALAEGNGFECGCCFGDELLENMFQCAEGHLFCGECSTKHAETKLGDQITAILCMDASGCAAPFPESELSRLLSFKSLNLYYRLKQAAELASAGIEGLETCPGCDYAVVIDNPHEKLFVCRSEGCKKVFCRKCRRAEHLPRSCEEVEADRRLDRRHLIEDAMTAALIRKCPKCEKAFLKESGCNKITCSGCGTVSCYLCRKAITNGYNHFDQRPLGSANYGKDGKCLLFDEEAVRDHEAVVAARNAAQMEIRNTATKEGMTLKDADLDVAAPQMPPKPAPLPQHPYARPQPPMAPPVGPGIRPPQYGAPRDFGVAGAAGNAELHPGRRVAQHHA